MCMCVCVYVCMRSLLTWTGTKVVRARATKMPSGAWAYGSEPPIHAYIGVGLCVCVKGCVRCVCV